MSDKLNIQEAASCEVTRKVRDPVSEPPNTDVVTIYVSMLGNQEVIDE